MFPGCAIKVREDNLGLCYIMGKKSSSCALTWTVAKAIRDLADARRVNVKLEKAKQKSDAIWIRKKIMPRSSNS